MSLVENIRLLCKKEGISVPKLEKKLGFGNGAIYNWDKNSPSVDKLQKVANYFKVSIAEVVGWGDIYDVGWAVKEERELQGMSLEDLSEETAIAPGTLKQFEMDAIPMSDFALDRIAGAFGMSTPAFLVKYNLWDEEIPDRFDGDVDKYLAFKKAEKDDAMHDSVDETQTIAAHHDGEDWTEDELKQIEQFKEFLKSKRKNN